MRALLPAPGYDEVDLHEHYARDWLDRGGLRMNFVSSVDGAAAAAGGLTAPLQTPGDNRVFAALRDLADVVVVGAGTARDEGYRAMRFSTGRLAIRRAYGLPDALPIALVSRSLRLDPGGKLFSGAGDGARTVVLTTAASPVERRAALEPVADVVVCGERDVDPRELRHALEDRGYRRILSEGGPSLFGDLAAGGVVDELCLSITPVLCGPAPPRVIGGAWGATAPITLRLHSLLEEDGALFCRYRLGDGPVPAVTTT